MDKTLTDITHGHSGGQQTNGIEDSPRNNDVPIRPASSFDDVDWWDELFDLHLGRYPRPGDLDPCSEEAMFRWMERLEMAPPSDTSLKDFIALNPDWPLIAWLGTMLELKHAGGR